MSLDAASILDAVVSHAAASGHFERVNGFEPTNAPGNGLTAAVWVQEIGPVRSGSGLTSTTGRLVLNLRIYASMQQDPPDAIDPAMLGALDALMTAYSGDFELGGNVRNVDLLGQAGVTLSAQAGYIQQDGATYRVYTLTIPLIVNDLWSQSP
ncbi:hypothetical protein [Nonomuraea insulae]|uniref:Tail terminator n=1 Tax=Nonomuraea insulae TaxID=1616787 RepID=A0ABW1DBV3_9ACTN